MSDNQAASQMTIWEHLNEARKRIIWALIGIGLVSIPAWFVYPYLIAFITAPLSQGESLNFTTVGAAFDLQLRTSIWLAFLLSSPWWIAQIWLFIAPGLLKHEKRYLLSFGLLGCLLFALGAGMGIWTAPHAVEILNSFTPPGSHSFLTASNYVNFYMRLVVIFGLSALLPELLIVANFLGLLPVSSMLKIWRPVVLAAFVFAAIANPLPNPWSMTVQALILVALYLLSVGVCALRSWLKSKKSA